MLSLPLFAFMPGHVRQGFVGLSTRRRTTGYHPYTMLALNLLSQLVCVSGVNQLSSVSKKTNLFISLLPPLCATPSFHFRFRFPPAHRHPINLCLSQIAIQQRHPFY